MNSMYVAYKKILVMTANRKFLNSHLQFMFVIYIAVQTQFKRPRF